MKEVVAHDGFIVTNTKPSKVKMEALAWTQTTSQTTPCDDMSVSTRPRGRVLAPRAEAAHDLRDVHGGARRHLGPLLLLLLPEDNGAEAGPSVLGVVLQLGVTRTPEICGFIKRVEESRDEGRGGEDKVKIKFWSVMDVVVTGRYRPNVSVSSGKNERGLVSERRPC